MSTLQTAEPVMIEELEGGALWRIRLNAPKANVLDGAMIGSLSAALVRACESPDLKALIFEGVGPNFSFGASVEEHLPGRVREMLAGFHDLFRILAECSVATLAAVRGHCLGGGLELAAFCHRVFAAPDAQLGQPEIKLGVFAPVGSLVLPERMGRSGADHMLLTGRILSAEGAQRAGLVDEIADDPFEAARQYAVEFLLPHSACSLRHAVSAARHAFHGRFLADLETLERTYLDDLMATADAVEGIAAFLEKRSPHWRNA